MRHRTMWTAVRQAAEDRRLCHGRVAAATGMWSTGVGARHLRVPETPAEKATTPSGILPLTPPPPSGEANEEDRHRK